VSTRLGSALTEHLRRKLTASDRSYVLVEGVPASVAEGMAQSWDETLPELAIASTEPQRFGAHALGKVSGTHLRNRRDTRGVVLVLCDGEQVPDRQSLNLFESVSPSVLLNSPEGMGILSRQHPAVDLDGPARAVREAINRANAATRPSAVAVATYLDRVAAGEDALGALPALGGSLTRRQPETGPTPTASETTWRSRRCAPAKTSSNPPPTPISADELSASSDAGRACRRSLPSRPRRTAS